MRLDSVSLTGNSCVSGVAAVLYLSFTTSGWEHFLHIHFLCLCSSYFVNDPLSHGNNTTCGAMCYIISPAFLSAYEGQFLILEPFFFYSERATKAENHSKL